MPKIGRIRACVTEILFLFVDFRKMMCRSTGNLTTLHPVSILTVSSEGEVSAAEFRREVAELIFTVAINPKILTV
jgi:hypothetical protein